MKLLVCLADCQRCWAVLWFRSSTRRVKDTRFIPARCCPHHTRLLLNPVPSNPGTVLLHEQNAFLSIWLSDSFHSTLKTLSGSTQLSVDFKTFNFTVQNYGFQINVVHEVPCSVSAEMAESLKELLLGRWADLSLFSSSYKL